MPVLAPISPVADDTDDSIDTADIERVVKSLSRRSPVPRSHFDPPSAAFLANRGRVVTLGMFIIDLFEVTDPAGNRVPGGDEAIGGGGIYAATAARLFLPPSHVGFIADKAPDFPPAFENKLRKLGQGMVWFRPAEGKTTRALNVYSGAEVGSGHQTFQYLSRQPQLWPSDFLSPISPISTPRPEWIHVVCDISRAGAVLDDAEKWRSQGWNGELAWEPLIRGPDPDALAQYVTLARRFAIFSPNHLELQTILEEDADVETCARLFHGHLAALGGPVPAIVVRAGADGAFTLSRDWTGWVPAYFQDGSRVVDPTGGGNSFFGGLLAGLVLSDGDYRAASIYAATAASFAIEQRGLPVLTTSASGTELWNDESPWDRLHALALRVDLSD
ncbi:putative protein [Vanrija pseudolonga]|uniref:Purtative protein n=1 Tax=Vanrija pseudolonga TaxID=143232 RepID=A0AAF0YES1_9TREE|nr:purtative protein [Vanrija pseudolonga]WOO84513.1 purtative protein [Vanrija pseudolonga]